MEQVKTPDDVHDTVIKAAAQLVKYSEANFDLPIDAVLAMILASSSLAVQIGMPLADLQEGIRLAYGTQEAAFAKTQGSSNHVH